MLLPVASDRPDLDPVPSSYDLDVRTRPSRVLRRATAQLGVPVVAGPVEATALGKVLVPARAHVSAPATLEELRANIARGTTLRRSEPS